VPTLILLSVLLAVILAGCGPALPDDAQETVLNEFDPDTNAIIDSAKQVEPLQQDLDVGAEEVWCVNITFTCWSCDYGEWRTCGDNRLVRRIDGEWQVSLTTTDEEQELWEARGCELLASTVDG
jgi:hypothetical protein